MVTSLFIALTAIIESVLLVSVSLQALLLLSCHLIKVTRVSLKVAPLQFVCYFRLSHRPEP